MHGMQVSIIIHLSKNVHLILASYLTLCLLLALNIFIGFKEDLDNMDVVNPPVIPVNFKRLPSKQKKAQNGIGAIKKEALPMPHIPVLLSTLLLLLWKSPLDSKIRFETQGLES